VSVEDESKGERRVDDRGWWCSVAEGVRLVVGLIGSEEMGRKQQGCNFVRRMGGCVVDSEHFVGMSCTHKCSLTLAGMRILQQSDWHKNVTHLQINNPPVRAAILG
jgi:hypothetical protein